MNNEQITQEILEIKERQAESKVERSNILNAIKDMKEDIRTTKKLAEDVHILAINVQNMQKTLEETKKDVNELREKDFNEFTERKKTLKQDIISKVTGVVVGGVITFILWLITFYINNK